MKEQIAVTIKVCHQIGIDDCQMFAYTKVFDKIQSISEIEDWIKIYAKNLGIADALISHIE